MKKANSRQPLSHRLLRTLGARIGSRRLSPHNGRCAVRGLRAEVEILRDRWGVPHIRAEHTEDVFFAQGFVHAQDRLWQMELNRRVAHGTLSEILGPPALETDRMARIFGFHRLAAADLAAASVEARDILSAYASGVNAWLQSPEFQKPVEFSLLRHQPADWDPLDSLAFSRVMIWQMAHSWYADLIRARLIDAVGPEAAAELEIVYPENHPDTITDGAMPRDDSEGFLPRVAGSNAWAVHGSRTESGQPLLCNDPHLPLTLPATWYLTHLHSPEYHATGTSIAALPGLIIGHNANIAWGVTLAFVDSEDLVIEEFNPEDPTAYKVGAEWQHAVVHEELIAVKGAKTPHTERVLVTRNGPVVTSLLKNAKREYAVRSMALRQVRSFQGWLDVSRARDWQSFVEGVALIEAPPLNIAYADVEGNIGYCCSGRVPLRGKGDGRVPAPGWDPAFDWQGEIPVDEMPRALNPPSGMIVTCNNRIVSGDYPHNLGSSWMNGYRARRITDVLESREAVTAGDCRALQTDVVSLPGREFVQQLQRFELQNEDARLAAGLLGEWDGGLHRDSNAGAVYEVARYFLVKSLLESGLDPDLAVDCMGRGVHPVLLPAHAFFGHDTVAMLRMMEAENSWWMTRAGGVERALEAALANAVSWLRARLGPDPGGWEWGHLHQIGFPHAFSQVKVLDVVFSRGPVAIGGDTDTPCQTAMRPEEPYAANSWSPSYRQIIDLGDLSNSRWVLAPGQSGQLGSPHYDDLLSAWEAGEDMPMLWTEAQVREHAQSRLTLSPVS